MVLYTIYLIIDDIQYLIGTGNPNGSVSAPIGSYACEVDAGSVRTWQNTTGGTVWVALAGGAGTGNRPFFEPTPTVPTTIYVDNTTGSDTTGTGLVGAPYASILRAVQDIPIEPTVDRTIQLVGSASAYTLPITVYAWNRITIAGPTPTTAFSKNVTVLTGNTVATQFNFTWSSDFASVDSSRGQLVQWVGNVTAGLAGKISVVIENTGGVGGNTARLTSPTDPFAGAGVGDTANFLTLGAFLNFASSTAIVASANLVFTQLEMTGANTAEVTLYASDVGLRTCRIGPPGGVNATLRGFYLQPGSRLEIGASTDASGTRTTGACYYAPRATDSKGVAVAFPSSQLILCDGSMLDGLNTSADTHEYVRILGTLTERGSIAVRQMASTRGVFSLFGGQIGLNGTTRAVFFMNSGTVTGVLADLTLASPASYAQMPAFFGTVSGFPYAGGAFTGSVILVDSTSTIASLTKTVTASLNNSANFSGPDTSGACIVGASPAVGQFLDGGDATGFPASGSGTVSLTGGVGAQTRLVSIPGFFGQRLSCRCGTFGGGNIDVTFPASINVAGNTICRFTAVNQYFEAVAMSDSGGTPRWQIVVNGGTTLA